MPAKDTLTVCPICHVVDTTDEFPGARGPAKTYPVVRCRRCGLVFQKRGGTGDSGAGTGPAEAPTQNRFGRLLEEFIRLFRRSRVRMAQRLMPAGGSTLDIGCGRGLYLRLLKERGFTVRGTELVAAGAGQDVPIDTGEVTPGRYPDGSFDLISMWHVLEHLTKPDVTLEACFRALKPDGVLLIAVPNYASAQARLGGEQWLHLDLPRHIFHFTRPTLQRLLAAHGFRVVSARTGQWEMDPFGLLQTVLNRMGLRHNALFDTLRNDREAGTDLTTPYRAAMLLIFPLGMTLAVPCSLVLRLLGRAGTLIVVARRCE